MDNKTFRKLIQDGDLPLLAIAAACKTIVEQPAVRVAWTAVRPHDRRLEHAFEVIGKALENTQSARWATLLLALALTLNDVADDIRHWTDSERFICERAVAAVLAVAVTARAVFLARDEDGSLPYAAETICRRVAEATIEPIGDVRDRLLAQARQIEHERLIAQAGKLAADGAP